MNLTEWNELIVPTLDTCFPSITDWLRERGKESAKTILSHWFRQLGGYDCADVCEAIEDMHRNNQGPQWSQRDCFPAFIRQALSRKREARRLRTEWKEDRDPAWTFDAEGRAVSSCPLRTPEPKMARSDVSNFGQIVADVARGERSGQPTAS